MAEPSTFSRTPLRSFQSKDQTPNSIENSIARKTQQVAFNGSDAKVITAPRPAPSSQPMPKMPISIGKLSKNEKNDIMDDLNKLQQIRDYQKSLENVLVSEREKLVQLTEKESKLDKQKRRLISIQSSIKGN